MGMWSFLCQQKSRESLRKTETGHQLPTTESLFEDDKFPLLKKEVYSKDYLMHKYSLNLIWRQDFGTWESNQKICLKRVFAFLFAITTGRSCRLV